MKLKFYFLFFLFLRLFTFQSTAQCLIPHSSLDHRIQSADLIVEGKIVNKTAFRGKSINIIFTKYELEVYKVFRGNTNLTTVYFIEQGGELEGSITKVIPSLEKEIGAMGVFMLTELDHRNILDASDIQYQPYNAHASMISYNKFKDSIVDVFEGKIASREKLYKKIKRHTHQMTNLKEFPITRSASTTMMPVILNIFPTTAAAGVGTEITITGNGFGDAPGNVAFDDPNDGTLGSFITATPTNPANWSNTSITIEVPSGAGTGRIGILTLNNGPSSLSTQTLTVPYNIININSTIPKLINDNCDENGGYQMLFSTNFVSNSDAVTAFRRAVTTWQSQEGYAFYAGTDCGTTTVQTNDEDGLNVVGFQDDLNGAAGRAYFYYSPCPGPPEVVEIDIFFAKNINGTPINWYYEADPGGITNSEIDFETIALHEIGHTHQLRHVNDNDALMYFRTTGGTTVRVLSADSDLAGAGVVTSQSVNYTPVECFGNTGNCSYEPYKSSEDCALLTATPVELSFFNAKAQEKTTLLSWQTINELNNDYFKIEHSLDGIHYAALTEIRGAGTTQGISGYRYTHISPAQGDNYYRLSQTDFDGTHEVLGVRLVRFKPDGIQVAIQPNPVRLDNLQMIYTSPEKATIQTTIYSVSGVMAQQQTMAIEAETNQLTIPVSQLPNGVYLMQTIQNETVKTIRFIKSN